jgi:hypothetical protein
MSILQAPAYIEAKASFNQNCNADTKIYPALTRYGGHNSWNMWYSIALFILAFVLYHISKPKIGEDGVPITRTFEQKTAYAAWLLALALGVYFVGKHIHHYFVNFSPQYAEWFSKLSSDCKKWLETMRVHEDLYKQARSNSSSSLSVGRNSTNFSISF